jgi:hypothetical protein
MRMAGEHERAGAAELRGGLGVVHQRDIDLLRARPDDVGQPAARVIDRDLVGGVSLVGFLVRREARVADSRERDAADRGDLPIEDGRVGLARDRRLGQRRVVVAADVDVGHPQLRDRVDVRRLRLAAPVVDIAGVDDEIDVELGRDGLHHGPCGRVEVHVGDVQDLGAGVVRFVYRQRRDCAVQLADVGHHALQLRSILLVPVGDAPCVTEHGRRVGQQPLISRLLDGVGVERQRRRRTARGQHAERREAGDGGLAARPEHQRREDHRAEHAGTGGLHRQPANAVGELADRVLADPVERVVGRGKSPGAPLVERVEPHAQADRAVVGVHLQRAERRDLHQGVAAQRRRDAQLRAERTDVLRGRAAEPDAEQDAEQRHDGDRAAPQQRRAAPSPGPQRPDALFAAPRVVPASRGHQDRATMHSAPR